MKKSGTSITGLKPKKAKALKSAMMIYRKALNESDIEKTLETHLKSYGARDFVREYEFHPDRKWRFDFAFLDKKIAIELDGGVYSQGAHTRGKGFEKDCLKLDEATHLGWKVFRFSGQQVMSGEAILKTIKYLRIKIKC